MCKPIFLKWWGTFHDVVMIITLLMLYISILSRLSVPHERLLTKLDSCWISGKILKWIKQKISRKDHKKWELEMSSHQRQRFWEAFHREASLDQPFLQCLLMTNPIVCVCPDIAWESIRKRTHTQLVIEHSCSHSCLSSLSHSGRIMAERVDRGELVCAS